jgi:putative ABC transport system permease protein
MNASEAIRLAFHQIRSQKLKSFFAVVGVIIGVMFLITVVSVVEGMNRYIEEDLASAVFGINTLTVRRTPEFQVNTTADVQREYRRRPQLRMEDAEAIRRNLRVPALVGVTSSSNGSIVSPAGVEVDNVRLIAASAEVFGIRSTELDRGRVFTGPEDRAGLPVVVLGYEAADKLFGAVDPIGRTVRIPSGAPSGGETSGRCIRYLLLARCRCKDSLAP